MSSNAPKINFTEVEIHATEIAKRSYSMTWIEPDFAGHMKAEIDERFRRLASALGYSVQRREFVEAPAVTEAA